MADPASLSTSWTTQTATGEHAAYYSPTLVLRSNDHTSTAHDTGIQMLVMAEGNGLYTLSRAQFTLRHHTNHPSGEMDILLPVAHGLRAEDAITEAFAHLGRALEAAKRDQAVTPQAWKHRIPQSLEDAHPLSRLPAMGLPPENRISAKQCFDGLSSQWGKKTTAYQNLPRLRPDIGAYDWR